MTNQQITYLATLHSGQWFGFDGKPEYKNLWVAEGYTKPLLREINDGVEQAKKQSLEKEAEAELRQIVIEELIADRLPNHKTAIDSVKAKINNGTITSDSAKAIRDEIQNQKSL